MKNMMPKYFISSLTLALAVSAFAAESSTKEQFESHGHTLNATITKNHAEAEALRGISVETGVPVERVQALHHNYPKATPAGILIACVLADNTKQDPETYVKKFVNGKNWAVAAKENNVPYEKIDERLTRVEDYIKNGGNQRPVKQRKK